MRLTVELVAGDSLLFGTSESAGTVIVTDDDSRRCLQGSGLAGVDDRLHVAAICGAGNLIFISSCPTLEL